LWSFLLDWKILNVFSMFSAAPGFFWVETEGNLVPWLLNFINLVTNFQE
jgi:hypothetical protein